ncbi:MAG: hypothetical protein K8T26_14895 [Lentisphaerae bacterium]|nr:hypothetical protein [Lentisphaerota bacterium]
MRACLLLPLLLTLAFSLAARLDGWRTSWSGTEMRSANMLAMLLGDSRRMFANHFFVKADVYFHSGYYPGIFDDQQAYLTPHISEDAGAVKGMNRGDAHAFRDAPRDWIDRFSRRFIPNQHTHLDTMREAGHEDGVDSQGDAEQEGGHDGGHPGESEGGERSADGGLAGEMLPWLRVSVALDPHRVESYVVTSYWLRERLGRADEAEKFLREGLVSNPNSFELYFELGRVAFEARHDNARAMHLWRTGLEKWEQTESTKREPDLFMKRQILAFLARAEEVEGHYADAYAHLLAAKAAADDSGIFNARIERLRVLAEAHAATATPVEPTP